MPSALISVNDKTNLDALVVYLLDKEYTIYSTGGTLDYIQSIDGLQDNLNILSVSSLTKFPEILNGRVKTLHPNIYGGLLAKNDDVNHQNEITQLGIQTFDLVVVNLYPFQKIIKQNDLESLSEMTILDNIDIGGVSLIRASAKNYHNISLLTSPKQYTKFINLHSNNKITLNERGHWATTGFQCTSEYDTMIAEYYTHTHLKVAKKIIPLKYGSNPQQIPATLEVEGLPFSVINGNIGYINVLDFIHGYLMVREIDDILGIPAVVSMKHTSPAGLAVGIPIDSGIALQFDIDVSMIEKLSPETHAFIRSRNCDPLSSFGDFIICSGTVDKYMAELIRREVSDGIMATNFTQEALQILKKKKNGNYIIVKGNLAYYKKFAKSGWSESKSIYGMTLKQPSNNYHFEIDKLPENIRNNKGAVCSIVAAYTSMKYTQSNNIAVAFDGQVIGIGAGQQNRVDCVRLACKKAQKWVKRQSVFILQKYLELKEQFPTYKRQELINIIYNYIETLNDDDSFEYDKFPLVLTSDGFFPFSDSIEVANEYNVKHIIQPGGSVRDKEVVDTASKYEMSMYMTGARMFYH